MYDNLNDRQKEAVFCTEGPLLILAGAGSGKTRVLTHRTAYLIKEKGVAPYNIMAITFTNKAAGEMRERIAEEVGHGAEQIWVATFHSTCVKILRRYADHIGYENSFTIYDGDDQKTVMKEVCKKLEIDTKIYKERTFLNAISSAKDELTDPIAYALAAAGDYNKSRIADVYKEYQATLKKNNAMDFDDLIMKTVELFKSNNELLQYYQNRFCYIMVDEYQDTNTAQFELVRLLASGHENLCVVGDDDQSIYKFRGANIYNILNFEKHFPNARVIKLEQNYRSTQIILDAANGVIANNKGRKAKSLWTKNGEGEKIDFQQFEVSPEEAAYVAFDIKKKVMSGQYQYKDCAILYRTNAQSRAFEERFVAGNIPYRLFGGVNFYARKEIKDILSYLKTIDNAMDDLAVKRIINVPKRGIGATSILKVQEYADYQDISFFDALQDAEQIPTLGRAASKIMPFVSMIRVLRAKKEYMSVKELMELVIEETGYVEELKLEDSEEAEARIENIDELISKAADYDALCQENEIEPTLSGFLEEVALVADIDNLDENQDYVVLMTLHSAKGLEFPQVYLVGMEDGLFPGYASIMADNADEELEEERRLAYVGITRAKQNLTITCAKQRMLRGEMQYNKVSRFVAEIPRELLTGAVRQPKPRMEIPKDTTYMQAKKTFQSKPYAMPQMQKSFGNPSQMGSLDYAEGDRVRHIKFGEGTVQAIVQGGRDYEVTVDFDTVGTKKMFATFAKLKKL